VQLRKRKVHPAVVSIVERKVEKIIFLIGLVLGSALWFPQVCPAQIPASYFGIHIGAGPFPLKIKYGSFRNLASRQTWVNINICSSPHSFSECQSDPAANSSFNFSALDAILAQVKAAGVDDALFTLSYTPPWAVASLPARGTCTIPPATCILPPDINPDGSGVNAVWDNWVENMAAHVNNPTWLQTHAHVKYWEPWNEVFSDLLINGCCKPQSITATYAQLLRLTEDTRCVIAGTGTIHNYPAAGRETACSVYLSARKYSPIDRSAQIVFPSQSPPSVYHPHPDGDLAVAQNLLYCNDNPRNDLGSTTSCTWSGGQDWMSAAIDIIAVHFYVDEEQPETALPIGSLHNWVRSIQDILSAADKSKPLWNGEGSCGTPPLRNPRHIWADDYSMAGFVPRYAALLWSAGVTRNYWFMYDTTQIPYCPLWNGSSLTPAGIAWNTTYDWLVGAKPVNTPFCSNAGSAWTCALIEANGRPAELVWDAQFGPGGATGPAECDSVQVPTICGSTTYKVPALYSADWVDITGTSHPFSSTVTIGAVPILLEGGQRRQRSGGAAK